MSYSFDFAVIGGDNRQLFLANILSETTSNICYYGLTPCALPSKYIPCFMNETITACTTVKEAIQNSKYIIGPTPFCQNRTEITSSNISGILIKDFINYTSPDQKVYAGAIPNYVLKEASVHNLKFIDIMKWESVAMLNAVATAEGAICEAIKNSFINIQGSKILILGFGRCGQILAKKLSALDASISICVRKEDVLSSAIAYGYDGFILQDLSEHVGTFDFIFNSIPSMILDKNMLLKIDPNTVIIDIASSPGGVDFNYANDHCYNANLYLGLPGKMSPKTSAKIQLESILKDCYK